MAILTPSQNFAKSGTGPWGPCDSTSVESHGPQGPFPDLEKFWHLGQKRNFGPNPVIIK